jgi:polysaccharide biosynthesis protein PslH
MDQKNINYLLEKIKPDSIYCQLVRPAEYVKNYHFCNKSLDIMDALSIGMERRSKNSNFIAKILFLEEANRLKKYERQILNYFEKAFIISEQDKNYLLHPKEKEIIVLPNGVSEKFYDCKLIFDKKYDLVFTGNMSYSPNIEASNFIIKKLYPELKKIFPELKILISGSNPSSKISRNFSSNIEISGWVDDIRESYLKSHIFIAPMFSGTGMQNKILEAMSLGIPCITSSLANNAILAENKKNILIADNLEQMIDAIIQLKSNPKFYHQISEEGKEFILKNYTWNAVNKLLTKNLSS